MGMIPYKNHYVRYKIVPTFHSDGFTMRAIVTDPQTSKELLFALGTIACLGWIFFPHTLDHAAFSTIMFIYLPMLGIVLLKRRASSAMRLPEENKTSE